MLELQCSHGLVCESAKRKMSAVVALAALTLVYNRRCISNTPTIRVACVLYIAMVMRPRCPSELQAAVKPDGMKITFGHTVECDICLEVLEVDVALLTSKHSSFAFIPIEFKTAIAAGSDHITSEMPQKRKRGSSNLHRRESAPSR